MTKSTKTVARAASQRASTRRLYVVEADGKRRVVVGATGVVIRQGNIEVELSFPEGFPLADEFVATLSTKEDLLTLGPGCGNFILVRASRA